MSANVQMGRILFVSFVFIRGLVSCLPLFPTCYALYTTLSHQQPLACSQPVDNHYRIAKKAAIFQATFLLVRLVRYQRDISPTPIPNKNEKPTIAVIATIATAKKAVRHDFPPFTKLVDCSIKNLLFSFYHIPQKKANNTVELLH